MDNQKTFFVLTWARSALTIALLFDFLARLLNHQRKNVGSLLKKQISSIVSNRNSKL